jgi:hypothetical protein
LFLGFLWNNSFAGAGRFEEAEGPAAESGQEGRTGEAGEADSGAEGETTAVATASEEAAQSATGQGTGRSTRRRSSSSETGSGWYLGRSYIPHCSQSNADPSGILFVSLIAAIRIECGKCQGLVSTEESDELEQAVEDGRQSYGTRLGVEAAGNGGRCSACDREKVVLSVATVAPR